MNEVYNSSRHYEERGGSREGEGEGGGSGHERGRGARARTLPILSLTH